MTRQADHIYKYLEDLAEGLEQHFPGQDFEHIKLLGLMGSVSTLYNSVVKSYLADFNMMPIEQQVLVTLRSEVADEPAELARVTSQTRAGMTGTLDRLEGKKLARRVPHPHDRRKTRIEMTRKGEQLADAMILAQNTVLAGILDGSSERQLQQITESLKATINLFSTPRKTGGADTP